MGPEGVCGYLTTGCGSGFLEASPWVCVGCVDTSGRVGMYRDVSLTHEGALGL
jgi:hypothetical protein